MSWLKEVFDFSNDNKDPFIKILLRIVFVLVVVILCYLAYALITHQTFIWKNDKYGVLNTPIASLESNKNKSNPNKADSIKKSNIQKPDKKVDSVKHKAISKFRRKQNNSSIKVSETDKEVFNPEKLSRKEIERVIEIIKQCKGGTPPNQINITILYKQFDFNTEKCAWQLYDYLRFKGYRVIAFQQSDVNFAPGINIYYIQLTLMSSIDIDLGLMDYENRPIVLKPNEN